MSFLFPNPKYRSITTWVFIIISIGFLFFTTIFLSLDKESVNSQRAYVQFIQLFFCVFVLTSRFRITTENQQNLVSVSQAEDNYEQIKKAIPRLKGKKAVEIKSIWIKAKEDTEEFKNLLVLVWASWALYFAISALRTLFTLTDSSFMDLDIWATIVEVTEVLFNNFTFVAFALCFYKLDEPKIVAQKEYLRPLVFVIIFLMLIQILLLILFPIDSADEINTVFKLFSGILNAIAIAAVIGRIESKSISPPPFYMWAMLLYSALQPLIVISSWGKIDFISGDDFISLEKVMAIANFRLWLLAIGKGIFFLFILWLLESKRLINYFLITPLVKSESDAFNKYRDKI